MNKTKIAVVVLVRLAISLASIYLLDLYYPWSQSFLNYFYGVLIGVFVMLLDPRGATIVVHIYPTGDDGYRRMVRFIEKQNAKSRRWVCSVKPDNTGQCLHYALAMCAETFALFGWILAWEISDNIAPPNNARFAVSVENGVVNP